MNDEIQIFGFPKMALLERIGAGGHVTYWRHLCSNDQMMYVMNVIPQKLPKNSLKIKAWDLRQVKPLFGTVITQIDEVIQPTWMHGELDKAAQNNVTFKWAKIAWMLEEGKDLIITDQFERKRLVNEAAKLAQEEASYIRQLLTRHLYFGGHVNALMNAKQYSTKDTSRPRASKVKLGRPNSNVVLGIDSSYEGADMNNYYYRELALILNEDFVLDDISLAKTFVRYRLRLRGFNKDKESGENVSFPVDPKKIPENAVLYKWAGKIIKELQLIRDKIGEEEWSKKHAAQRGHAQDLTHGVVDIYDFDGTPFNMVVRYSDDIPYVGKPCLLVAIDRRSMAIVGFFVWLKQEDGYSYKQCLFNAFTPKDEILARYKVPHLKGFVYGPCEHAFFDRGPGISIDTSEAVTERVRVDGLITKPRDPKGKAAVEYIIGRMEKEIADIVGGFERTDTARAKDKHAKAERIASVNFEKFMELILTFISDYNLYQKVDLTDEMLKSKNLTRPKPNPKSVFLWYRSQRRGDAAYLWPREIIYKRLIGSVERTLDAGMVHMEGAEYSSTELMAYYESCRASMGSNAKSLSVKIYRIEESNKFLLWEKDDGTLWQLEQKERSRIAYGNDKYWFEQEFMNQFKNAGLRVQSIDSQRKGHLGRVKTELMRKTQKIPPNKPQKGDKIANRMLANEQLSQQKVASDLSMLGVAFSNEAESILLEQDEWQLKQSIDIDEVVPTDW